MADHDDLTSDSAPPWEDEPAERDDNTADIFGAPPAAEPAPAAVAPVVVEAPSDPDAAYTVLARKYRPRTFEDLIGQEAMVRTLTNAFATGRIAHAFMLTGVRGVGKTTIARLLAQAAGYEYQSISAVFSGVADLKKAFEAAMDGAKRAKRDMETPAMCPAASEARLAVAPPVLRQRPPRLRERTPLPPAPKS